MKNLYLVTVFSLFLTACFAQSHPSMIVADDDIEDLKNSAGKYELWDATVSDLIAEMDEKVKGEFDVPVPKDPAGGYTHEKHKANGILLKNLGLAYQLTGDAKYATYATSMFQAYAKMYPSVALHPVQKSYARGKLFWQQLNEAVFLCDAIQGYDCILPTLTKEDRELIEGDFILPFADFISIETPFVFNKIHNHGVWANAAVGMTGFALDNDELIRRAFYGIDEKGKPMQKKVDGFGDSPYGFFTQTTSLFSPDGYYTEGPYYQRYAMTPFLLFAQSINQNLPELDVFSFADGMFIKAVETLFNLTDDSGEFFPINDHLKGMGLMAPSMVWAVDFLYARTKNPQLLSIAEKQGLRTISMGGMEVARDIDAGKTEALNFQSAFITDGPKGESGGVGIIRNDSETTVFKFATQGMGHGHFDRLNMFHYNGGTQVFSDYGAARYVNVKAKEGGRYLPENDSYAKQTIAHNTVAVNERSQFDGVYDQSKDSHADLLFYDLENEDIKIFAAEENKAFADVAMKRVVMQVKHSDYAEPLLLDVFLLNSDVSNKYDLPYHFCGEVMSTDYDAGTKLTELKSLGSGHGYEHLWLTAQGKSENESAGFTWMNERKFFSITTVVDDNTELLFTRNGANDPHFNLRSEPTFIVRQSNAKQHTFASVVECHGYNNASTEIVSNQEKTTKSIRLVTLDKDAFAVVVETKMDNKIIVLVNTKDNSEVLENTFKVDGDEYQWEGNYKLITK